MGVGGVIEVDPGLEDGVGGYAKVAAEGWHGYCGCGRAEKTEGGFGGMEDDMSGRAYV